MNTYVVLPLLEDVADELLLVVLPERVLQVLGAGQHALSIDRVRGDGWTMDGAVERVMHTQTGLAVCWIGSGETAWGGVLRAREADLGDVEEDGVRLEHLVNVRLGLFLAFHNRQAHVKMMDGQTDWAPSSDQCTLRGAARHGTHMPARRQAGQRTPWRQERTLLR